MNSPPSPHESPTAPSSPSDLRVVFFSDSFPHRNGVGAYYCDLIDQLRPRVAAADLVCPDHTRWGNRSWLSVPLPGDTSQRLCLPNIPKAYHTLRQTRPHVIVAASPGPFGMTAAALARHFNVRFCFGYHTKYSTLTDLYWDPVSGALMTRFLVGLDRVFFRHSDAVFTNGRGMMASAGSMGARRIELIGTPIDPLLLDDPVPMTNGEFGPVLFVGRLAPEKNLHKIVEAARALPDTPFIIAGEGPLASMIRQADAELPNLEYVGWVNRKALLNLLDERCEVLLLPSQVEAFGTVAAEAMARQRLVVVSNRCGIIDWPELAAGVEIVDVNTPLAPKLTALSQLPYEKREEKRLLARRQCLKFVERTIDDWLKALLDVGRN